MLLKTIGVLQYWNVGRWVPQNPVLHYSTPPVVGYSSSLHAFFSSNLILTIRRPSMSTIVSL